MKSFQCPSCGAEVQFKSSVSVFGVCSYCSSMLVRRDLNVENWGKMAQLTPDLSPLQITSSGVFAGKRFEVVGRTKLQWSHGTWNEWYLYFHDGSDGWLAEAQGFWIVSFQHPEVRSLPELEQIQVGGTFQFPDKRTYTVEDIKQARCVGTVGELPFLGASGRERTSVDLTESDGRFAGLDYSEDGKKLYLGQYVELEDLKFTNLREFDGW